MLFLALCISGVFRCAPSHQLLLFLQQCLKLWDHLSLVFPHTPTHTPSPQGGSSCRVMLSLSTIFWAPFSHVESTISEVLHQMRVVFSRISKAQSSSAQTEEGSLCQNRNVLIYLISGKCRCNHSELQAFSSVPWRKPAELIWFTGLWHLGGFNLF